MQPLVSILIPAYNAERSIADTIRSARAQTWPRKEIIIVDEGSHDRTLEIARQLAAPNVSVVTQQNQGAAAARNKAFELCLGDYIQWLDADDLLSPDKIAKQLAAAEECGDQTPSPLSLRGTQCQGHMSLLANSGKDRDIAHQQWRADNAPLYNQRCQIWFNE